MEIQPIGTDTNEQYDTGHESQPVYGLVRKVVEAIREYDLTKDHCKHDGGADCIRCKLVDALPEWYRK